MRKIAFLAATAAISPIAFDNAPAPAPTPAAAKPRVEPQLTAVVSGITMPTRTTKRGSTSVFPFDTLVNVGDAFGIKNRTAKSLSSIISNANKKAMVKKTDAAGAVVFKMVELKDANGVVVGQTATNEPEMIPGKRYAAFDVEKGSDLFKAIKGTDLEGSTVLVFREA